MAGRLDGKVCVITGAGGGMGREAAVLFTAEGAKVCAADVNLAAAAETVGLCTGEAFAFQADVVKEADGDWLPPPPCPVVPSTYCACTWAAVSAVG